MSNRTQSLWAAILNHQNNLGSKKQKMYIMAHLKIVFRLSVLIFLSAFHTINLSAQEKVDLRLSVAATAGYAPLVTYGSRTSSGVVIGVYGELEYGKVIGRLQYTRPLSGTFGEDNLEAGVSYHGALGYRFDVAEKFFVGILASGGATVVSYSTGINGSSGDRFTNVSPQVGINITPAYQLTDALSIQTGLRYYKGFKAGDRGQASDLADISIALRYSFFQ